MGLHVLTAPGYELPVLTAIHLQDGIDEMAIRNALLNDYDIEIGGGFGNLQGHLIRIGLMGYNSNRKNVSMMLSALEHVLPQSGHTPTPGAGLAAADAVYKGRG
jgi:alanine-glyoxylate transaminase/serine-glyoxylate transaminase/serine-pyruvate transaminase